MTDRRSFLACLSAAALLPATARAQGFFSTSAAVPPLDPAVLGSAEAPLPGLTIAPELYPMEVTVKPEFLPGSIIVLSSKHLLYFITKKGHAIRYGVAVGKAELQFRGVAQVGEKIEWPKWKPTQEMVERNPAAYAKYAENGMEGGPKNPLGARAIYLHQNGHDTAVRIHGTIEPNSIGKSVSNGCIRMVNEHVIDLYGRVQLGAQVTVY
ncbi:MAG TPA: L,D-transpeptidase [Paracoccaceae bacterium]|nr:L,D-transpeptidase [Paracoccaceae bacterium]